MDAKPISDGHRSPFTAGQDYQAGLLGEKAIEERLREAGAYVISHYTRDDEQTRTKGPRLYGNAGAFVLPDLDVISPTGIRIWVEVKTKATATAYRNDGNVLQHGIDLAHYYDYLRVEALTKTEVWIVIQETDHGWIGCGHIPELRVHHERRSNTYGTGGMVYFNRSEFKPLETLLERLTRGDADTVVTTAEDRISEWRFV